MIRNAGLAAFLLTIVLAGLVNAGSDPATVLATLANQRRNAARRTYEVLWVNYRERTASGDSLYRWSLRWLAAESELSAKQADQVAACKGHWERMRALERLVKNVQRTGQTTIDEVSAAEYYRVEAEIWLLRAEEKKDR